MRHSLPGRSFPVVFCLIIILFSCSLVQGQDTTYWRKDLRTSLNFHQASFSDNWQGGGVNSIGLNGFFTYRANYARGVNTWDNIIDLAYGIIKNEGQGSRKSHDRIFLDTKYGRKIANNWSLYSSLTFLSQFYKGYEYDVEDPLTGETNNVLISNFLSPAFITSSWGFEYKPVEYFSVRIGPFSPRATIVTDEDVAINSEENGEPLRYGVPADEKVRMEWWAFQMLADFNKDIAENLNLKWKYMLYVNYEELEFRKFDHRLDAQLVARVNKFIDVGLGGILVYDLDQDDDAQLSQALTLGIVYSFKNYEEEEEED